MTDAPERTDPQTAAAMPYANALLSDGYCIVKGAAPAEVLKTVRSELEAHIDQTPYCEGDFYGWQTVRVGSVIKKSRSSHTLVTHPAILSLAEAALGPYCDWFQLNLTQVIALHPGQPIQAPHRDQDMWHGGPKGMIEYQINVIWPLTPFTPENGGTLIWPGSHRRQNEPLIPLTQAVSTRADIGDALVYLGSTLHCAGANSTDQPREGLVVSYSLGWLKSYENNFLAYPPEVARTFPRELRDLIGYRIHRPNLNNYEGQSPAVLLEADTVSGGAKDELLPEQAEKLKAWTAAMQGLTSTAA